MENEVQNKREFSEDDIENALWSLGADIVLQSNFVKDEEFLVSCKERCKGIIH